ncbi:MAG: apolipoprotein N-acyltransferase [Candidatus Aminicenantes bacterium]|nr:apolipoprotein N-acyltransferase [Candidatus Aminicenantes bacterium]
MTNDPKSGRLAVIDLLGAAASGALTALAFPKLNLMFFAWISLLPLLFLLVKARPRQGLVLGWVAGAFFYGLLLYWIPNVPAHYGNLPIVVSLLVYLLLILLLASTWALFGLGFAILRRRLGETAFFVAPFLWVALEYGVTHVLTGFPWGLLGLSQYKNTAFIQVAAVTGVYGVSFLLVMFQSLFAGSITHMKRLPFAFGTIALAAVHVAGFLGQAKVVPGPQTFRAAVIQGNVSPDMDWNGAGADKIMALFEEHMDLTRQARDQGAKLIVWPELSVPLCFSCDDSFHDRLEAILTRFVRESGASLLLGTIETSGEPDARRFYNSALQLSPDRAVSKYAKMHLVPFGEYIPYRPIFGFVERLAPAVGALTPGRGRTLHSFRDIPYGSPICYEIAFPDEVRRFVKNGARFLVTITNDGWYGATSAPYQHFAQAVFRAVENRRFVLRAATTGVSGIIDPFGRVVAQSEVGVRTFLAGDVTPQTETTFYSRYGDAFSVASVAIAGLSLILALIKRRP